MKTGLIKVSALILVISVLLLLVSCGLSAYVVVGMYKGSVSNVSEMGFVSLMGNVRIGLNNTYTQDTDMSVTASLEGGSIEVYWRSDIMPEEELLFRLEGGESIELANFGYLTNGEDASFNVVAPEGVTAEGFKMTVKVNEPTSQSGGQL